ncbi:beta-N-acetylhexosaminidase [Cohnella xylanilytica]|uniref:beta-N-acetylhexosaminidase n=1 Tax=Cohnella xylanilytica TaxID=557555 RepID=UPI001C87A9E0|nr:beta-N-acetylhexosaminidase [Cohnella xylanilytica]
MNYRPIAGLGLALTLLLSGCARSESPPVSSPSPSQPASSPAEPSVTPTQPASPGASSPASPSPSGSKEPSAPTDPVKTRMEKMTLEEKVGQLILAGLEGKELDAEAKRMIRDDKVGGVILYSNNVSDLKGTVALVNAIKRTNAANPAPIFVSVDQEGGRVSRLPSEYVKFPANAAVGATGDADLAEAMGQLLGRALTSSGFNMDFAPVLDVNSNPDNPVIGDRSFGSSADLVSKLGLAELTGLRSEGVIPVVKHFPGHGDTSVDSHLDLPVVDKTPEQLAKLEWVPFQAAVKNHAEAVMVAHILYPKIDPDKPGSLSKRIVGDILRGDMGYDGVVITDDLGMGAIAKHYPLAEASVMAIEAGADILLVGHGYDNERTAFESVLKSVKSGKISEERLDESVYRILSLKSKYELQDAKSPVPDLKELNADIRDWREKIG